MSWPISHFTPELLNSVPKSGFCQMASTMKLLLVAVAVLALSLASLATTVTAQQVQDGSIDFPCDPNAGPDDDLKCNATLHLVCSPLWNHYSEGACRCTPGTFWMLAFQDEYECRVGANMPCSAEEGAPGCVKYSTCMPDGDSSVCTCNQGHYPLSNGSYCVVGYGGLCATVLGERGMCDSNLRLTCSGGDSINRRCDCTGANIWSETRGKCVGTVETSSSCTVNDDCVDDAICVRPQFGIARCHCAPGFQRTKNATCALGQGETCDPEPTAAVKCNADQNLECDETERKCTCTASTVLTFGSCLGRVGHDCNAHNECGAGTLCHDYIRKCICSPALGYIELVNGTCGRLGRGAYCRLGGFDDCPASEYLQCAPVPGTTYGRCECFSGSLDENGRCIRMAGSNCATMNQNCVPNAACIQGVCTCLSGSAPTSEGRCLKTVNETCDANPDNACNGQLGLRCTDSVCACPTGQEWNPSFSRCVALASGACSPSMFYCTANAACNPLGFCECAVGYSQAPGADRRCLPSFNTTCSTEAAAPPCNRDQFLTCAQPEGRCACEFPLHQVWEAKPGAEAKCVSVLGGRCGGVGAFEELDGRELKCIETSVCLPGANRVPKCSCDESAGMVPDGMGKCKPKEE